MKAIYRRVRISPKKANLVASLVRGKKAKDALHSLRFMPKKGARILYQVLRSAVANAENNFNQNSDALEITHIIINKGPAHTRYLPISRGRVHPILKRTSHISIELNVAPDAPKEENPKEKKEAKKDKKPVTKDEKKEEVKKETKEEKSSSEKK